MMVGSNYLVLSLYIYTEIFTMYWLTIDMMYRAGQYWSLFVMVTIKRMNSVNKETYGHEFDEFGGTESTSPIYLVKLRWFDYSP